jgi:cytochrome c556
MKSKLALALLASLCLAMEQDDVARHKEWMDTAQDVKDDLKDALDAKLAAKAVENAGKLAEIGKQEEEYWKKAGQDDAVTLAQKNRAASERIGAAAKAGRFDQALQAYGDLEATCRACHDLHPEKRPVH